jgi:hypothetical protein
MTLYDLKMYCNTFFWSIALRIFKDVRNYGDSVLPSPGDGPPVMRVMHEGAGHEEDWPIGCEACGKGVADKLKFLGVGSDGKVDSMHFLT